MINAGEIKDFVNDSLLDGRTMDDTTFLTMANLAKAKIEENRPWVMLRAEDSSGSVTGANTWETTHSLPTRFSQPYPVKRATEEYSPLILVSGQNTKIVTEIQWAQRLENQNNSGRFAVDYANDQYIITGSVDKAYTPYWSFIQYTDDFIDDADTWGNFPTRFYPLIAYLVAIMEKAADYDEVNLANIKIYSPEAATILSSMYMWNANLESAFEEIDKLVEILF